MRGREARMNYRLIEIEANYLIVLVESNVKYIILHKLRAIMLKNELGKVLFCYSLSVEK